MQDVGYYREQAARAKRLAKAITDPQVERQLHEMAQDYEELADDIEAGAVEVRRPDLLSPKQRS